MDKTDNLMKEFKAFLEKGYPDGIPSEETAEQAFYKFLDARGYEDLDDGEPDAEDYLGMADRAKSEKKKLEYIEKALELEPDNLNARLKKIIVAIKQPERQLEEIDKLIKQEEWRLNKKGFFEPDCMGEFWGLFETRPYMRLFAFHVKILSNCGMMSRAAQECERMLELCENDNLGMRFFLMHLYALLEREKEAKNLLERYSEDISSQMLLPMSILYYKLRQEEKAREYLDKVARHYKDLKKFVNAVCKYDLDRYYWDMNPYGYQPFHMEELLEEYDEFQFLFQTVPAYFPWAKEHLKTGKKKV